MAYAESMGMAAFLQSFGQTLLSAYERERQQKDEINKYNTERMSRAIDTGRVQYQPDARADAPGADKMSLTGSAEPGIGNFFKPSMPTAQPVEIPKAQPLTLQQQSELLAATRAGKPMADRYVTVQPEAPEGEVYSTTVSPTGEVTKNYRNTDYMETPAQKAKRQLEVARARELRANNDEATYMKAYAIAARQVANDITLMEATSDEKLKATNDIVESILSRAKSGTAPVTVTTSASAPVPAPASKPTATPKVGETRGGYRFKGGDPSKQTNWEKI